MKEIDKYQHVQWNRALVWRKYWSDVQHSSFKVTAWPILTPLSFFQLHNKPLEKLSFQNVYIASRTGNCRCCTHLPPSSQESSISVFFCIQINQVQKAGVLRFDRWITLHLGHLIFQAFPKLAPIFAFSLIVCQQTVAFKQDVHIKFLPRVYIVRGPSPSADFSPLGWGWRARVNRSHVLQMLGAGATPCIVKISSHLWG